jgi:hypothetical protein
MGDGRCQNLILRYLPKNLSIGVPGVVAFLPQNSTKSLCMLVYLILPAVLWLASCRLLSRSKGQKGFDIFFWHFLLLGLEGVAALLLLDFFQVPSSNRITLGILGLHTFLLFGYSLKAFLATRWRRRAVG